MNDPGLNISLLTILAIFILIFGQIWQKFSKLCFLQKMSIYKILLRIGGAVRVFSCFTNALFFISASIAGQKI